MSTPKISPTPKRRQIRRRPISPSNPPATAYHAVYTFAPCITPGCMQLHVPQATGSERCPECLDRCLPGTELMPRGAQ